MDGSDALTLPGVIMLLVGVPLIAIAVFFWMRTRRFLRTAVDTTGVIVDLIASSSSEGGMSYQAVVDFQTADGQTVRWTERMASNPAAGDPGDQVPMKYNPQDPSEARIARSFRMWFVPGLLGGLGLLFTIIGVVMLGAGAA